MVGLAKLTSTQPTCTCLAWSNHDKTDSVTDCKSHSEDCVAISMLEDTMWCESGPMRGSLAGPRR